MAERAVLACVAGPTGSWELEDDLGELSELARSAGAEPVAAVLQRHRRYDPATLLTTGKVQELAETVSAHAADVVLCNRSLTPRQQIRLEDAAGCKVVDRVRLILDIFACRARTREGRLQVELAQLTYMLPRLSGLGRELSRTGGGIGTRGPGETKLEADRRRVRARIAALEREIADVAATRQVQRGGRRRTGLPVIALVGYTNAGKSTLHRVLCDSDVYAADQLFATLDPTTRLLALPGNHKALLTDTVGFVHDLPHALVAAFSATLEEVSAADLLLEIVDRSHPQRFEQRAAVEAVLRELGAAQLPRILVWNKADLPPSEALPTAAASAPSPREDLPQVEVSALSGEGLAGLRETIGRLLPDDRREISVFLPFTAQALVQAAREQAEVLTLDYGADGITLCARCSPALAGRLLEAAERK